jgi:hypothetical protein
VGSGEWGVDPVSKSPLPAPPAYFPPSGTNANALFAFIGITS